MEEGVAATYRPYCWILCGIMWSRCYLDDKSRKFTVKHHVLRDTRSFLGETPYFGWFSCGIHFFACKPNGNHDPTCVLCCFGGLRGHAQKPWKPLALSAVEEGAAATYRPYGWILCGIMSSRCYWYDKSRSFTVKQRVLRGITPFLREAPIFWMSFLWSPPFCM